MPIKLILPGLYKHYKGGLYHVFSTAKHTETGEIMVIYQDCRTPEIGFYVRPASMWFDKVGVDEAGQPITRFRRADDGK